MSRWSTKPRQFSFATMLDLLLSGKSHVQIAKELNVHPNNIKRYEINVYDRHGVNSRIELMALYIWRDRGKDDITQRVVVSSGRTARIYEERHQ